MTDFIPLEATVTDVNALPVMPPGRPVGRDELLKEIYSHLQARRPVLLHGASGMGKTTLAAALAAAFTNQAGGVLWLTNGSQSFASLTVRVARGLGIRDVTTSEQPTARVGMIATAISQKKPFIVIDNIQDALAIQQFIEKCAGNFPMLLLSETELSGNWESVRVSAISDMDSVALFKQKAGINDGNSDIDIFGIAKQLEYKAFALVMAARGMVAAKQNPGDYLKSLKQVQAQAGDGMMAAIALSYRALNNALQGLVLMLGATFTGEGSADFIAAVSGVPEEGINQAMNILSQLYLVEKFTRYGKPYYRLHPLVYQFAQAALEGKNQLTILQKKVHDASLAYAKKQAADHASSALAKEMDNFIAAAAWAAKNGNRETANHFVSILTEANNFVQDAGYVYELLQLRNTASGSTSAFPAYGPEPVLEAEAEEDDFYSYDDEEDDEDFEDEIADELDDFEDDEDEIAEDYGEYDSEESGVFAAASLDDIKIEEGMSSAAIRQDALTGIDVEQLRQALAQARQQGDKARQLQILQAIGKVQIKQGKETEAIATYNEILESYEAQNEAEGTLDTLNMLAALLTKTSNSQAAIMHATRGIQLASQRKDDIIKLQLQLTLGDARQDLGETEAAVDSFKQALELARQHADKQNEALSLYKLGYAYLDNGATDEAIHTLDQARSMFREQGKREYEGRVLGALGSAHSELERWSEAIGYYQSAWHIAREVKDKSDEMLHLSNLAQAQVEAGKLPDALLSYRQTLHLAYQSGKREEIVSTIVELVRLMMRSTRLLGICSLLLTDAIQRDVDDRDVLDLVAEVNRKKIEASVNNITLAPVVGTAQEYAANAYSMLDN